MEELRIRVGSPVSEGRTRIGAEAGQTQSPCPFPDSSMVPGPVQSSESAPAATGTKPKPAWRSTAAREAIFLGSLSVLTAFPVPGCWRATAASQDIHCSSSGCQGLHSRARARGPNSTQKPDCSAAEHPQHRLARSPGQQSVGLCSMIRNWMPAPGCLLSVVLPIKVGDVCTGQCVPGTHFLLENVS